MSSWDRDRLGDPSAEHEDVLVIDPRTRALAGLVLLVIMAVGALTVYVTLEVVWPWPS